MIILLISWLLLIVTGSKFADKNQFYKNILSDNQSNTLRGICAIEIVLGHIGIATESLLLYPYRKAGILFVGIFFMLSGYGLSYGVSYKEKYLEHFFLKRVIKILIPAVVIWIIAKYIQMIIDPPVYYVTSFIKSTNWYVWEILGCYFCFWLVYKLFDKIGGMSKYKWGGVIIVCCTAFFIGTAHYLGVERAWYGSTICFPLGISYQQYEEKLEKIFQPKLLKIILLLLIEVSAICIFYISEEVVGDVIARNVAALAFCIIICLMLQKITLCNRVSIWLGKCSYEIYLIHFNVIFIAQQYIPNKSLLSISITIITLVLAFVTYSIRMFLGNKLERI